ncbi:hypothetical protein F5144DRAFT_586450 [Chaetomium tenue]|uniref:Uncharacterized protein n=1 Tax=Chaetomium tenue TaxID=1854479 RepID=A0ACB7NVW8_9PEZI|nr:hypothetical protein F5144DRAFT_586450 [Chaetomium globosum]
MKKSNVERTTWRTKCRTRLSQHIHDTIGLDVDPLHVRLIPGDDDQHRWQWLPEKGHLFEKHLSKLSTGPLMELYREVGSSFHAVKRPSTEEKAIQSSPIDEIQALRLANSELESLAEESSLRLKQHERMFYHVKQQYRVQKRQNKQLKAIIGRCRSVMIDFIQDSTSVQ